MRLPAVIYLFLSISLYSCGQADKPVAESAPAGKQGSGTAPQYGGDRQLNINILWDLSDRIDSVRNPASPQHYLRDIDNIQTIVQLFKADMKKKGAYKARGKLRVFFSPAPEDAGVNNVARDLSCDLSALTGEGANRKKKETYDELEKRFAANTRQIYKLVMATNRSKKKWEGSDIWRFFKNDVKQYCVEANPDYRNILVILTDGYIYHRNSIERQGNRTSSILPDMLKVFRGNPGWKELFEKKNYGLINTRHDLQNLEILVLEITPGQHKDDEDYIRAYLGKWFEEMGVNKENYKCYNSDLPDYTRGKIASFFAQP